MFNNYKKTNKRINELFDLFKDLKDLDQLYKRINSNVDQSKKIIDSQVILLNEKFTKLSDKIANDLSQTKTDVENSIKSNSTRMYAFVNEQKQQYDKIHSESLSDFNKVYLDYKVQIDKLNLGYQKIIDGKMISFTTEQTNAWKTQLININKQISDTFNNYELNMTNLISKVLNNELNKLLLNEISDKASKQILDSFNKTLKDLGQKETDSIIEAIKNLLKSSQEKLSISDSKKQISPPKINTKQEYFHKNYNKLRTCLLSKVPPMIVGPAGSGKSLACEQLARELELNFYVANRVQNSFELTGFVNAQGKYNTTQFYEAYTKGGIFLFDEVDASAPEALVTINNAIAQGYMSFPGHASNTHMHENFMLIAAGNTYGKGATSLYTGRNILDAATLDRFMIIDWDYDIDLEKKNITNIELLEFCWELRDICKKLSLDNEIIISTRSIISLEKIILKDQKTKNFNFKDLLRQKFFLSIDPEKLLEIKKEFKTTTNNYYKNFLELFN